ncbi:ABC transporter substrate-binding protein [Roseomonas alkaliterrae]|uniref:Peptide/nickel transport system substrate-binding protein n=1 Tax=Neoroseomonas alkaliterrae TaxID=1452450 RepID=A0A840Y5A0_9PROT|nr:ABC transporter substrate-binding protein [Neoroseomonas alkaliterrae]MBB5689802.1 peptide/nickel transport system substrate-binding protein [Neoroseomonas alkaliterrae]MBR0675622.1 ABC transporter substrate-binding protein [Neoroseomonas alkaliterrae]
MDRRTFLKAGAGVATIGASGTIAAPALSQGAAARTLRFVPQANLANFDPIWGTQYVVRNAACLVWDTLYGFDSNLTPQRQMVESEEVTDGGKTWTFRLREGLRFHDGEPVRAQDVAASLNRWAVRDGMGQMIRAIQEEPVSAVDDRTFRWRLKQPYPKMLVALGKNNTPMAFIMPERLARTDPFQQVSEFIGSGPMRLARNEWVPGARAVFTRFEQYVPRNEPPSWLAGGKRMNVDRIEWIIMPDPATASAALMNGEIDWWESPLTDLVPALRRNRNVQVDIQDPLGNIGSFRFNHLHAPFNDVRARRAVAMALSQEDYMRAVVGDDRSLWQTLPSFFTPGTPLYTEAGGEILKGPRNLDAARRLLAESGYNGQPITVLVAQDQAPLKAMGEVTNALLTSLGMRVDFVATDWGTVGQRRASKAPPGQGGWHIFHTWHAGADCTNPAAYLALRTHGDGAWFGWPSDEAVEAARLKWFDAPNLEAEKAAVAEMNAAAMRHVTYIPTGFYKVFQAWRRNVTGVVGAPIPFFWNVSKS